MLVTVSDLEGSAGSLRKTMLGSSRSTGDSELDRMIFQKTLDEVSEGWLKGPIDIDELQPTAIINRRFRTMQSSPGGKKLRLID